MFTNDFTMFIAVVICVVSFLLFLIGGITYIRLMCALIDFLNRH